MGNWTSELRKRLAHLDLAPAREAEIIDELAQHLDDRFAELRARGVGEADALRAALLELDADGELATRLRRVESAPAVRAADLGAGGSSRFIDALAQDVRYAVRSLRSRPGFTAITVLTMGLAIGACTLIFSAVNGVLLRPLPFRDSDRLVTWWGTAPEKGLIEVPLPEGLLHVFETTSRTTESAAFYGGAGFNLTGVGDPARLSGANVTEDFFQVLGVNAVLGRALTTGDAQRFGPARVAVISHSLWLSRFGGDSSAVGRVIHLGGNPMTIVGVMPPTLDFPWSSQVWVPWSPDPERFNCWCYRSVARLAPGYTVLDAKREMAKAVDDYGMARRDIFPDAKPGGTRLVAMPLTQRIAGSVITPLMILSAAVGCVLLIACANVANLMLARATVRAREMAVRCCLGATRGRIASQLFTESLIVSVAGGALGLFLAALGLGALRRISANIPRADEITIDLTVLAFVSGVAVVTGMLCGLAPALRATRINLQDAIKQGTRGSAGAGNRRLSDGFVVTQFALSLVLLVGAALLIRSYRHLVTLDPGFRPENVLVARVQLPYPRYDSAHVVRAFFNRVVDEASKAPGMRSVAAVSRAPFGNGGNQDNILAEGQDPKPGEPVLVASIRSVTPGYFETVGTPILRGRSFTRGDRDSSLRVAIVDESLARHFWPNEDAVGKRIRHAGDTTSRKWMTIVGVVPNVKESGLDEKASLQVYQTFDQRTVWGNHIIIRSQGPPEMLVKSLRKIVAGIDPLLPVYEVQTMSDAVARSLATRRLTNALLTGFASLALLLAAIGIYGVVSVAVNDRIKEFGIRLALGARASDVGRMVLRRGAFLALVGVALGVVGAFSVTRYMQEFLFGVNPIDWVSFLLVATALTVTALAACYLPARRATRADPMDALRSE